MAELFKIESILERTAISPEGEFYKVMEVRYITRSGIRGTVDIKKTEFSKEKVREVVEKEARALEESLKL
jgi:hypothetical protein